MNRLITLPRFFAVVCLSVIGVPVYAAGFQINEISPSLQGDATAGAAAANNDVSAMFINPATLSTLVQNQAYLGANEIFPQVQMTNASAVHTVNTPGTPSFPISSPVAGVTSQKNITKPVFVPDGYFAWRLNNKLVAGISLAAPYGLVTKYYDSSVVRFAAVLSSVNTINLTPALAYQLNDKVSVGLGFQLQYLNANFSNFNGPYTGVAATDSLVAASYPTYLKANGWGYGFTIGGIYKLDNRTTFGLGYRSIVSTHITGDGQQYTSPGGVVPAPNPVFLFNAQTSTNASVKTPAILTLSAARDINNWTVKATAQVNFWYTFNQLSINMPEAFAVNSTIPTKWKNAWFFATGADYRLNNKWTLKGGIAYDESPTQNAYRDPRIPDGDRYWLTFGATYFVNKHISIDGAYEHLFVPSTTVNVAQATGTSATSTLPLEVNQIYADYKSSVDIVGLALRYSF